MAPNQLLVVSTPNLRNHNPRVGGSSSLLRYQLINSMVSSTVLTLVAIPALYAMSKACDCSRSFSTGGQSYKVYEPSKCGNRSVMGGRFGWVKKLTSISASKMSVKCQQRRSRSKTIR